MLADDTPKKDRAIGQTSRILSYGHRQILGVFLVLLFAVLSTTSFFILRPVLVFSSEQIANQLAELDRRNLTNEVNEINKKSQPTSDYLALRTKSHSGYSLLPLVHLVKNNLSKKLNKPIRIVAIDEQPDFFWFQVEKSDKHLGFSKSLIGTQPQLTLLLLAAVLLGLSYWFTSLVAKKLNRPLSQLRDKFSRLSNGDFSNPLPNHTIPEIQTIFDQINQVANDLQVLLEQKVVFLSGVSHDIRTPITKLKLLLAVHENQLPKPFFIKSEQSVKEIEALINLYLDAGQGLVEHKNETIYPEPFIEKVLASFAEEQSKKIVVKISTPPFVANKAALERVITNLVTNALKYAPPIDEGDITLSFQEDISTEHLARHIKITLTDSGSGLKDGELSEVFKPFFRLKNSENRTADSNETSNIEGTGLGLAICRQICLAQDWDIRLSNRKSQSGLVVTLQIKN